MLFSVKNNPNLTIRHPHFSLVVEAMRRDNIKWFHQVQTAIYTMRNSLGFIMEILHAIVEALRAIVYGKGIFLKGFFF